MGTEGMRAHFFCLSKLRKKCGCGVVVSLVQSSAADLVKDT